MKSNAAEWAATLELGHAAMDETHREFTACCAALAEAGSEDFLQRLDALIDHCVGHFEQENRWMRERDFPPAACHVEEHEGVLDVMREARRMVADGDVEVGARLAQELPHWFDHHVAGMDRMLAVFMLQHEAASVAGEK